MSETALTTADELDSVNRSPQPAAPRSQVRSRERVIDLAEVFTHQREVKAMLNFVPDMFQSIDSTFLEPACGSGNFLVEILSRKLAAIDKASHGGSENWFEVAILRAVASIYAVDICNDNVAEAQGRLSEIVASEFDRRGLTPTSGFAPALDAILQANVICGDTLTGATDLVFYEWRVVDREFFSRTPFPLEQREYDLFDLPPEPLAPVHYSKLGGVR